MCEWLGVRPELDLLGPNVPCYFTFLQLDYENRYEAYPTPSSGIAFFQGLMRGNIHRQIGGHNSGAEELLWTGR